MDELRERIAEALKGFRYDDTAYFGEQREKLAEHLAIALLDEPEPVAWTKFADAWPEPGRKVITTNNIHARDAHGEHSHLWLVSSNLIRVEEGGPFEGPSANVSSRRVFGLSHWRYAGVGIASPTPTKPKTPYCPDCNAMLRSDGTCPGCEPTCSDGRACLDPASCQHHGRCMIDHPEGGEPGGRR